MLKHVSFCLLLGALPGCGDKASSRLRDLSTGDHSNVGSAGGGAHVPFASLESLRFLPNTLVPKGVFVSLFDDPDDGDNRGFVASLYEVIAGINHSESLIPTRDLAKPSAADLQRQEITLGVLFGKGHQSQYNDLLKAVGGAAAPYLVPVEMDVADADPWIQDFGGFIGAKLKGQEQPVYAVLDTYRNRNRGEYSPDVFMRLFHMPLVEIGTNADIAGQYGGNIGATPSATPYLGDSLDHAGTRRGGPSVLFDEFKSLGNPGAIKVASKWLYVGHVDEFIGYLPSHSACGSALVYAKPLEGLKVLIEEATDAEFKRFADEVAHIPVYNGDEEAASGEASLNLTKENLREALAWFRLSRGDVLSTELSDYDPTRAVPELAPLETDSGLALAKLQSLSQQPVLTARYYVQHALTDQAHIQEAVALLAKDSSCFVGVPVPQLFRPVLGYSGTPQSVQNQGEIAHLPGVTNFLALRDHVVVPDPGVAAMQRLVAARLGEHLGGVDHVHFIADQVYHSNYGEVHCGTNVIREMQIPYAFDH